MLSPVLLILFKIATATWNLLCFLTNLGIIYFFLVKNDLGILIFIPSSSKSWLLIALAAHRPFLHVCHMLLLHMTLSVEALTIITNRTLFLCHYKVGNTSLQNNSGSHPKCNTSPKIKIKKHILKFPKHILWYRWEATSYNFFTKSGAVSLMLSPENLELSSI